MGNDGGDVEGGVTDFDTAVGSMLDVTTLGWVKWAGMILRFDEPAGASNG